MKSIEAQHPAPARGKLIRRRTSHRAESSNDDVVSFRHRKEFVSREAKEAKQKNCAGLFLRDLRRLREVQIRFNTKPRRGVNPGGVPKPQPILCLLARRNEERLAEQETTRDEGLPVGGE